MKLRIVLGLLAFLSCSGVFANTKEVLEQLCSAQDHHIFLLSYPRSGNTWLRYCLEYLTQRPSFSRWDFSSLMAQPLAWQAHFVVDLNKIPIEKVHRRKEMVSFDPYKDKIILLVRNPKEAILRNEKGKITYDILLGKSLRPRGYTANIYFENLALYHECDKQNRILIYYEDLLRHPAHELARLLMFLHESLAHLPAFMQNYEQHKKVCLGLYKASRSGGGDLLFHSKKISDEQRKLADEWIATLYPVWWDTYLKDYYSEECLDYSTYK